MSIRSFLPVYFPRYRKLLSRGIDWKPGFDLWGRESGVAADDQTDKWNMNSSHCHINRLS